MSRATSALLVNEVRALLPVWLACLASMVVPRLAGGRLLGIGIASYVVGAAVLGSLVIGREYANRTLTSVLTLPVRRHRVLLCKLTVLAGMLVILMLVADAFVFAGVRRQSGVDREAELTALMWVPPLLAMSLTPWLTMLCRSALAGAVFSMVLPGLMQTASALMSSSADPGMTAEIYGASTFWIGCLI